MSPHLWASILIIIGIIVITALTAWIFIRVFKVLVARIRNKTVKSRLSPLVAVGLAFISLLSTGGGYELHQYTVASEIHTRDCVMTGPMPGDTPKDAIDLALAYGLEDIADGDNRIDRAIAAFSWVNKAAQQTDPRRADALNNLGCTYIAKAAFDATPIVISPTSSPSSIQSTTSTYTSTLSSSSLNIELTTCKVPYSDLQNAEEALNQAIRINPNHIGVHTNLDIVQSALKGEFEAAEPSLVQLGGITDVSDKFLWISDDIGHALGDKDAGCYHLRVQDKLVNGYKQHDTFQNNESEWVNFVISDIISKENQNEWATVTINDEYIGDIVVDKQDRYNSIKANLLGHQTYCYTLHFKWVYEKEDKKIHEVLHKGSINPRKNKEFRIWSYIYKEPTDNPEIWLQGSTLVFTINNNIQDKQLREEVIVYIDNALAGFILSRKDKTNDTLELTVPSSGRRYSEHDYKLVVRTIFENQGKNYLQESTGQGTIWVGEGSVLRLNKDIEARNVQLEETFPCN